MTDNSQFDSREQRFLLERIRTSREHYTNMILCAEREMRWLVEIMVCAACCSLMASAQEVETQPPAERITYFLIDASGSMKGENALLAEAEVLKILEPLKRENPDSLVSRSYFKAENRDLCSHPISISPAQPVANSAPQIPASGNNDYTALGTALESALNRAASGPADIFIISDGVQTPDCGIDICEVAYSNLPKPYVTVTSITVGNASPSAPLLSCIAEAEGRTLSAGVTGIQPLAADSDGEIAKEESAKPKTWSYWLKAFVRNWFWFFGVFCIAVAALAFGWRQSHAARVLEESINQIRSYQEQIRAGDTEAAKKLEKLVSSIEQAGSKVAPVSLRQRKRDSRNRLLKIFSYVSGIFGVSMLLGLAMLPSVFIGVSLEGTKQAAWRVFDSDFATAFAVLVIAIIFYAGSQLQRKQEARHNFGIVSEEATRSAIRDHDEAQRSAYQAYERQFNRFAALKFPIAASSRAFSEDALRQSAWMSDAKFLIETAKMLALKAFLPGSEQKAALEKETKRISELYSKVHPFWWSDTTSFIQLIDALVADGTISSNASEWQLAAVVVQAEGQELHRSAISSFANKLREQSKD